MSYQSNPNTPLLDTPSFANLWKPHVLEIRPLFAKAIPTKYVATKSIATPRVLQTDASKLFQNKTPKNCGAEIKGMRSRVATGFAIPLLSRPKNRISIKRIASWWKWSRSGRSAGLPNFHRRHIAKTVSATGQKKTSSIAKALTSVPLLIRMIADQTSKWPNAYAPPSPKNIFPIGKFNTINPRTTDINKTRKIETCALPAWDAMIDSENATEIVT